MEVQFDSYVGFALFVGDQRRNGCEPRNFVQSNNSLTHRCSQVRKLSSFGLFGDWTARANAAKHVGGTEFSLYFQLVRNFGRKLQVRQNDKDNAVR